MASLRIIIALIMLTFSMGLSSMASAQDALPDAERPLSFVDVCSEKINERGRLRYCDEYFRAALGQEADPILYLRERITSLRANHEANAIQKYESFLTAVSITAFLSIATIVLVLTERRISGISRWAILTSSAAVLVIIVTITAGWLGKYRAEHIAQMELGLLRDAIEAETSLNIAEGKTLDSEQVRRWTQQMTSIGQRFADNYGSASPVPDLDRFNVRNLQP